MAARAPGDAKNTIRRVFLAMADPGPTRTDLRRLWRFFAYECAYCGAKLQPGVGNRHIDHLMPASQGGMNAVGNRMLSCEICNAKEKLDQPWEIFLAGKSEDPDKLAVRRQRILDWQKANPLPSGDTVLRRRALATAKANDVVAALEAAVKELRAEMDLAP